MRLKRDEGREWAGMKQDVEQFIVHQGVRSVPEVFVGEGAQIAVRCMQMTMVEEPFVEVAIDTVSQSVGRK